MSYELIIIGGGPTGASAAVFAGRAGLRTVVVDEGAGLAPRAMVNNHLGIPEGITGPQLIERGRGQARAAGAEWIEDQVTRMSAGPDGVTVETAGGRSLTAPDVLLAQGVTTALATRAGIATRAGREPFITTVVTVDDEGRTSMPHVWAAGTVAGLSAHTIIAAGDGARVAVNLISERRGARYVDHDALEAPTPVTS